jgi:hypothetical protein
VDVLREALHMGMPAEKYARLTPDSPEASGRTSADVALYMGLETEGLPEVYSERDVTFVRSASLRECEVWLWSCRTSDGEVYAYVWKFPDFPPVLGTEWIPISVSPEECLERAYEHRRSLR